MLWQIDGYLTTYPAVQSSSLYTLWAGGNDFLALPSNPTPEQINTTIATAAGNIVSAIDLLAGAGAQNFLVLNLPDLGQTPRYNYDPLVSGSASWLADTFNQALNNALEAYGTDNPGINLCQLDTFAFLNDTIGGDYFVNDTDAWLGSGDMPSDYLFWDDIHPTTDAHWLLSEAADEQLNSCVPVPPSILMLISGLLGLFSLKKRLSR